MMKVWAVVLVAALAVVHPSVEAKRMGGGGSMGKQSSNVTQRDAAPRAPQQAPAQQQAAPKPATPAAAPAAPAKKPWGAMLGGLAAGLGLAWLANSLGFGEAFANMLMFGLLALAIMVVVGMVMRARNKPKASSAAASPFAFQGAGAPAPDAVVQPREYNPKNVGNDASARPWEQDHVPAAGGSMIGSGLAAAATNWNVPADFDAASFLEAAKRNFVTLQAAWDRGDVATLRSMMTDEMLSEVKTQLEERETQSSGQANQTDVVMIEAQLLGIEDLGHAYMASVEFSGMIREEASAGPSPFREVWNMTKPKSNSSGWLVAGLQALQ
ncbi:MAG: Tim44-like domain-containing protein [Comamonas sp.]